MEEPRGTLRTPADSGRSANPEHPDNPAHPETACAVRTPACWGDDDPVSMVTYDHSRLPLDGPDGCQCFACITRRHLLNFSEKFTGVDIPGVGHVRAVLPGREGEPGEFPAALKQELEREEREKLLGKLIFAAKDLAEAQVFRSWSRYVKPHCFKCGGVPAGYTDVGHDPHCAAGRVLRILDELQRLGVPSTEGGAR